MELNKILKGVKILNEKNIDLVTEIDDLFIDSRVDCLGGLFFCINGENHRGTDFMQDAHNNGAVAFIVEKINESFPYPQIEVMDVRAAMGTIAKNFFGVTDDLVVVGITGTNGKTTTSYIIKEILEQGGKKVGVIGTEGAVFNGKVTDTGFTTPDSIELFRLMGDMQKVGVTHVVMEVSAHAIALKKVQDIKFAVKILTNVTQDHLDYFKTFDNYAKTKMQFFIGDDSVKIVNIDDKIGRYLSDKNERILTYGLENPALTFAVEINNNCNEYVMNLNDHVFKVNSNLYGDYNVYNSMAAAVCAYVLNVSVADIKKGLCSMHPVSGRFNLIPYKNNCKIIIDFAHTPDGIEKVLTTARKFTDGKLLCLFGCGGNRDKGKRPIMAGLSEKLADFCIVTSDNPRFEKPEEIISEVIKGFNGNKYICETDRKLAIKKAISMLKENDTLVICGKGGEKYQDIGGVKTPYSDFDETYKNIDNNKAENKIS